VPYEPHIWGAGWGIQSFGVQQYFLHKAFPEQFGREYMWQQAEYVMGGGATNFMFLALAVTAAILSGACPVFESGNSPGTIICR